MAGLAPIVTLTRTVMDGEQVSWFRTVGEANLDQAVATASRVRVVISAELRDPQHVAGLTELAREAWQVHRLLRAGDDLPDDLVTHRRGALMSGVTPVKGE